MHANRREGLRTPQVVAKFLCPSFLCPSFLCPSGIGGGSESAGQPSGLLPRRFPRDLRAGSETVGQTAGLFVFIRVHSCPFAVALLWAQLAFGGLPLRFVLARSSNCDLFIESCMLLEAPFKDDFFLVPFFAASAAPAAICCFWDFALAMVRPILLVQVLDFAFPTDPT
jgi:hypothetical protein